MHAVSHGACEMQQATTYLGSIKGDICKQHVATCWGSGHFADSAQQLRHSGAAVMSAYMALRSHALLWLSR